MNLFDRCSYTFRQASAAETSRRRAGPDGAMHDRQCLRTRLEWAAESAAIFSPASVIVCHLPSKEQLLSPKLAHHFNLFLGTAAPIFEVLAQRFVFHGIPADANAQAKTTAA